jgi:hypothetical protein
MFNINRILKIDTPCLCKMVISFLLIKNVCSIFYQNYYFINVVKSSSDFRLLIVHILAKQMFDVSLFHCIDSITVPFLAIMLFTIAFNTTTAVTNIIVVVIPTRLFSIKTPVTLTSDLNFWLDCS